MSSFSLQFGQLREALVSAGLSRDAASQIANILGNAAQPMRHAGELIHDRTPANMRQVSPDARKHSLTEIDFRQGDPDHRPARTASSEEQKRPEQEPVVVNVLAPQQTAAVGGVGAGAYTNVQWRGGAASVDVRVAGNGEAAFIDPRANSLVGKNLRAEAHAGGDGRVRFFIERGGPDVVWKLQLDNLGEFEVVTNVAYEEGVGIVVTYEKIVAWKVQGARARTIVIPTSEVDVVTELDVEACDVIGQRTKATVLGTDVVEPSIVDLPQGCGEEEEGACSDFSSLTPKSVSEVPNYVAGTPSALSYSTSAESATPCLRWRSHLTNVVTNVTELPGGTLYEKKNIYVLAEGPATQTFIPCCASVGTCCTGCPCWPNMEGEEQYIEYTGTGGVGCGTTKWTRPALGEGTGFCTSALPAALVGHATWNPGYPAGFGACQPVWIRDYALCWCYDENGDPLSDSSTTRYRAILADCESETFVDVTAIAVSGQTQFDTNGGCAPLNYIPPMACP